MLLAISDAVYTIIQDILATQMTNMPNNYFKATGHYYSTGMWTAALLMIPGIYAIYRLTKKYRLQNK